MEDVSGAAATGGEEEAEDSSGKKRKVGLPSIFTPFSFFFLSSFFLLSFLPSTLFSPPPSPTRPTNKHVLPACTSIQDLRQTTREEVETGVESQEEQGDYR